MLRTTISRDEIHRYIKPQTVIWRPLFCYNGVMMPELHRVPTRTGKADPMLRIRLTGCGQDICEPCVSTDGHGMVCFLKGNLPECWTHLTVMRSGKSGSVIIALPECLPDVAEYIAWRLQVAALYHSPKLHTESALAALVSDTDCPGLQLNRKRLQMFLDGDNNFTLYETDK